MEAEDRLSNLPTDILHRILSFQDMRRVVQTQILSKRWISLGKSLPVLNFDLDLSTPSFLDFEDPRTDDILLEFVNSVLIHRGTSSNIFSISLSNAPDHMNSWIYLVSLCNVQVINVKYAVLLTSPYFLLPKCLFTCKTLAELKLDVTRKFNEDLDEKNRYNYPEDVRVIFVVLKTVDLPSLKTLCLNRFCFESSEFISKILAGCPVLDTLRITNCSLHEKDPVTKRGSLVIRSDRLKNLVIDGIYKCSGFSSYCRRDDRTDWNMWPSKVVISAPMLISFKCKCCASDEYVLEDLSSLLTAEIHVGDCERHLGWPYIYNRKLHDEKEFARNMMGILEGIQHAKSLRLSGLLLEKTFLEVENSLMSKFPYLETERLGNGRKWRSTHIS